ncbi:hypothetical protein BSN85_17235 [Bradyrhizobium brasilense]|nr:hypothetical protein BSN85_17235 [Bradyrhizobium brasilense]
MSRTRKEICQKNHVNSSPSAVLNDGTGIGLDGKALQYLSRDKIVDREAIFSDASDRDRQKRQKFGRA